MLSLDELNPYEKNPRKNDQSVQAVANSIKEFGFRAPIIVDRDFTIIAGHTRYKAAKSLGLSEVPVIVADDMTEEQVRAYRIADNSAGQKSEWDFEILADEIKNISIDMADFGFGSFELLTMMEDCTPIKATDDEREMLESFENDGSEESMPYICRDRVIITYDPCDKDEVMQFLGQQGNPKTVYRFEDLIATQGN